MLLFWLLLLYNFLDMLTCEPLRCSGYSCPAAIESGASPGGTDHLVAEVSGNGYASAGASPVGDDTSDGGASPVGINDPVLGVPGVGYLAAKDHDYGAGVARLAELEFERVWLEVENCDAIRSDSPGPPGNSTARGYYTQGARLAEREIKVIQMEVENCDTWQCSFHEAGLGPGESQSAGVANFFEEEFEFTEEEFEVVRMEVENCDPF